MLLDKDWTKSESNRRRESLETEVGDMKGYNARARIRLTRELSSEAISLVKMESVTVDDLIRALNLNIAAVLENQANLLEIHHRAEQGGE